MPDRGSKNGAEKAQGLYDRIADVQHLAMKINGYRASVAKYLKSLDLDLGPDSLVLDAGSGTGIVTLAFQDAGFEARRIVSLDLSFNSLKVAREQTNKRRRYSKKTDALQADVLKMPFADETFNDLFGNVHTDDVGPPPPGEANSLGAIKPGYLFRTDQ